MKMVNQGAIIVAAILTAATPAAVSAQTTTSSAATAKSSVSVSGESTTTPLAKKAMELTHTGHARFNVRMPEIAREIDALPPNTTGTIVMLGDSITEGFFKQGAMPKKIAGLKILNQGISGDHIERPTGDSGVVKRIEFVKAAKPAMVFVMIGTNDFWSGKELPPAVIPQYEEMFKMLKQAVPDATIVLQSVLPTGKKNAYMNPSVITLNERLKQMAAESGDVYLDLHKLMKDDKGELKDEYTNDGVHLNADAYKVWLKALKKTVKKVQQQHQ